MPPKFFSPLFWILVLASFTATVTAALSPSTTPDAIDVNTLLNALGLPPCIHGCVDPFLRHLHKALRLQDTMKNYDTMCEMYNHTTTCVTHNDGCGHSKVFDIATSGVRNLCITKANFIKRQRQCLSEHMDEKARGCDSQCGMINAISVVSQLEDVKRLSRSGGNLVGMLSKIGPICEAAKCYLPCFRQEMNAICSHSGGMTVDGLLKPFYYLAAFVKNSGPLVHKFLDQHMPASCRYLTSEESLTGIRKGTSIADN